MSTAALQRHGLMPPAPRGLGKGLALALVAHALLLLALTFAVNWRASEPEGVQAELWAAVPQIAAPARPAEPAAAPAPAAAPPPAPPQPAPRAVVEPQIAIEK